MVEPKPHSRVTRRYAPLLAPMLTKMLTTKGPVGEPNGPGADATRPVPENVGFVAMLLKPSDGLEPSTPSLPSSDEAGSEGNSGKPRARRSRKSKESAEETSRARTRVPALVFPHCSLAAPPPLNAAFLASIECGRTSAGSTYALDLNDPRYLPRLVCDCVAAERVAASPCAAPRGREVVGATPRARVALPRRARHQRRGSNPDPHGFEGNRNGIGYET
jgi:hypothetical protein